MLGAKVILEDSTNSLPKFRAEKETCRVITYEHGRSTEKLISSP